ncbi:IgGFc-binding protein-like [Saccostrea cucullata]|uniref:IgGFc-binding protein-like n=1 Tax=Saccostrea cuccullata TaxID=36930 RepID=UPI002ED24743
MSGGIHLQDINLNEANRPSNTYVSCLDRHSRGTEAGSDYVCLDDDQPDNLYSSIVSRQSGGIDVGSDYDFEKGCSRGNDNEAYDTMDDLHNGKSENVVKQVTKSSESRDSSEEGTGIGFLTKKRLVFGVTVLAIVVAIILAVALVTQSGDGDEQPKKNKKSMTCPNVPTTGMNFIAEGKTGIKGRQFLVCFTDNHLNARNQSKTIFILSDEDFDYKLISKFSDSTKLFNEVETQSTNLKEINVTNMISLLHFKIEEKAVFVEASKDVSVIIIDNYKTTSDSTGILPIQSLSNAYVISTPRPYNSSQYTQFAIASPANGTRIKIRFYFDPDLPKVINGITYRNGSEFILILNELQTYQIWHKVDMTGTLINASSPVAVFAGSHCQKIPFENRSNAGFCSKLDEQLPPIDRLDNMYIVPPTYNRMGTVLKIVSPFETRITYKIGSRITEKILQPNGYLQITFLKEDVVVIDSENPVLVTSFSTGSDSTGDPYMIAMPGIRQYSDNYLVEVPGNFKESYISLIIEEKSLYNLVLNGTEIIHFLNERKFYATVTLRKIKFVVLVLQISEGMLKIKSTNNASFGLIVYGHRKNDGHGFAGKAVLPDICINSN